MKTKREKAIDVLLLAGENKIAAALLIVEDDVIASQIMKTATETVNHSKVVGPQENKGTSYTKPAGEGYSKYGPSTKSGPVTDEQLKKLEGLFAKLPASTKEKGWMLFNKNYQLEELKKLTTKQVGAAITGMEKFTANTATNSQVKKGDEPAEIENL